MPTTYHRRAAPCSHCGDVVTIVESTPRAFARWRAHAAGTVQAKSNITQEHADPGLDGEVNDAVDDGCRRTPVR